VEVEPFRCEASSCRIPTDVASPPFGLPNGTPSTPCAGSAGSTMQAIASASVAFGPACRRSASANTAAMLRRCEALTVFPLSLSPFALLAASESDDGSRSDSERLERSSVGAAIGIRRWSSHAQNASR
jgi:hypothetical protein